MGKINGSRWWLHIYKFSYLHFIVLHIYMARRLCASKSAFLYAISLVIIFLFAQSRYTWRYGNFHRHTPTRVRFCILEEVAHSWSFTQCDHMEICIDRSDSQFFVNLRIELISNSFKYFNGKEIAKFYF